MLAPFRGACPPRPAASRSRGATNANSHRLDRASYSRLELFVDEIVPLKRGARTGCEDQSLGIPARRLARGENLDRLRPQGHRPLSALSLRLIEEDTPCSSAGSVPKTTERMVSGFVRSGERIHVVHLLAQCCGIAPW